MQFHTIFRKSKKRALEEMQLHQNRPDKKICELIDKMMRQGITRGTDLSEVLEKDHGIKIPPHFLAEYKYRKRKTQYIT